MNRERRNRRIRKRERGAWKRKYGKFHLRLKGIVIFMYTADDKCSHDPQFESEREWCVVRISLHNEHGDSHGDQLK